MVKHSLTRGAAALLGALMLASPAAAALSGRDMIFSRPGETSYKIEPIPRYAAKTPAFTVLADEEEVTVPDCFVSQIAVGADLDENDAAMRLYYLGMLTGSGTKPGGGMEFSLEKGLTRVESAVFAVRLMGAEKEASIVHYSHPFDDVPGWASDYVGYLYRNGLLDDLAQDGFFGPGMAESTERFMSYMLHALDYDMVRDMTPGQAAECARSIGLCVTEKDAPLTRGGAVCAMYNTLRTTMKNSDRVFSDSLVESGAISYQDAIFFLWNDDAAETSRYMDAVGYGEEWVLPDGYYKIKSTDGGKLLNVAVTGMNNDYEGVGVTLWDNTDDITQTFRVERTERGTYYIYSAASKNGYGRVIGATDSSDVTGLYSSYRSNAMEFNITGTPEGTWCIESAARDGMCLTSENTGRNGSAIVLADKTSAPFALWEFDRQGIVNAEGEELAIWVADSLVVTQGAFDTYSHQVQNALDIQPTEGMVRAPFNATVVRMDATVIACNAVWIQSTSPVRYADGSYDYMTAIFLHDNNISDLYIGQGLKQGEYFYHSGDFGISSGKHVHVSFYRGQYNPYTMRVGNGDVYAEDALFLPDDTYIYNDYGLDWKVTSLAD